MDPAHPLGVAAGEVVVDGHQVDALAAQPVEVGRQRGDERLALAGLHFGDPAEVERGAAHQLHVVVALADHADGGLAGDGERLGQDVVERRAVGEPISELDGLASQFVVGQAPHLVAERVDVGNDRLEGLDLLAFSARRMRSRMLMRPTSLPVAGPSLRAWSAAAAATNRAPNLAVPLGRVFSDERDGGAGDGRRP